MKVFLSLIVCCALTQTVEALLPPLYQSSNEIKSILNNEELGKKLQSGELIIAIQRNANGYEIITNHHRLQVDVINEPVQRIGPAVYHLDFHEPIPLSN